jgi:hypothetical protein
VTGLAAATAWLAAALIVLSDGRRALAAGLALGAAALAVLAWAAGGWVAASAVLAGGFVAAAQRYRSGTPGWGVMPPGSTPQLILSVVAGLVALWLAVSVTAGDGAPLRFSALTVVALMGARVLIARSPSVILTAIAVLALAVAAAAGLAPAGSGLAVYLAGALVAGGLSFVRIPEPHGA